VPDVLEFDSGMLAGDALRLRDETIDVVLSCRHRFEEVRLRDAERVRETADAPGERRLASGKRVIGGATDTSLA